MSSNFNFYLNRQGAKGRKGDRGEQGYSPSISVETDTAAEYVLKIQNEGYSFNTPNLRGNAIENTGGTYIRYNPATGQMYTGSLDLATVQQAGAVMLTPTGGISIGGSTNDVPTSAEVYDYVESRVSEQGLNFNRLATTLIAGNNVTLGVDSENETITINAAGTDLSSCVKTTGNQTISGVKTFTDLLTIDTTSGILLRGEGRKLQFTPDMYLANIDGELLIGSGNNIFLDTPEAIIRGGEEYPELSFENGNNNTYGTSLQYNYDDNIFTISSEGSMYLQTATNSINVDALLTSASLANYVTTNTAQNITQSKTFDGSGELHFTKTSHGIYFEDAIASSTERIRIFGRAHSAGVSYNDLTLKSYMDIQFELTGNGGVTRLSEIKSAMTLANSAVQPAAIATKEDTSNKVTSISSASTDTEYPTAKCVYDLIGDIESTLDAIIAGGNNTVALTVVLSGSPQYLTSFVIDGVSHPLSDFTSAGSSRNMTLQITSNVNHSWSTSATYGTTPSSGTVNVNSNSTLNIEVTNNGSGSDTPM